MPSMLYCHHEMRFEMFTEHEVEIFALHINSMYVRILMLLFNLNEFFLSIFRQHTDKNIPGKCNFFGIVFYCVLQDHRSF